MQFRNGDSCRWRADQEDAAAEPRAQRQHRTTLKTHETPLDGSASATQSCKLGANCSRTVINLRSFVSGTEL